MLITKFATVKWNAKTKKYYTDLGYKYTKMKDEFVVDVHDLSDGSNVSVDVQCDYCGRVYKKQWYNYILENRKSTIHKDSCGSCKSIKAKESVNKTYGVDNVFQLDDVKNKIAETNVEKYGVENPFQSEAIKEKIADANMRKYGVRSPLQNKEILEKAQKTCLRKYGVSSYVMTIDTHGEKNANWKGGIARQRSERFTSEYIQWRKKVYHRDNYTCQCCGIHGATDFNAHHIMNWKDYPDLRFDPDNGITLCQNCHSLFHSIYGKRHNNQDQLTDFINLYGKKVC